MSGFGKLIVSISYMRRDRPWLAERIKDFIAREFERDVEIADMDTIPTGEDFHEHIEEQVAKSTALIVVIGPDWLNAHYDDGSRAIDDDHHPAHIQIGAALKHDVAILPVLVDGARYPSPNQLPKSLRGLTMRNAFEIGKFEKDFGHLARSLEKMLSTRPVTNYTSKLGRATQVRELRDDELQKASGGYTFYDVKVESIVAAQTKTTTACTRMASDDVC